MIFLSLLVVLLLVQWWGSGAPLQYDVWYLRWLDILKARQTLRNIPLLSLILAVFFPVVLLGIIVSGIVSVLSDNWLFFIYVPVLLYSLGRGNFNTEVKAYIAASERGDSVIASRISDTLRGGVVSDREGENVQDWSALHTQTLRVISYRGFERMFAVLFWFCVLGAVGALAYRLSVLYREFQAEDSPAAPLAEKWLWVMEWPAVRLMGVTWALVGNFDSSFNYWQQQLLDTKQISITLLNNYLRGALGVKGLRENNDHENETFNVKPIEPEGSLVLIRSSLALLSRSLLLWVCMIAVLTLI